MTTKEKKLKLIKALGLEMGDIIKFKNRFENQTFMINEVDNEICLNSVQLSTGILNIFYLIVYDWIKINKSTRIGNKLCKDCTCSYCPLRIFDCDLINDPDKSLYDILDSIFDKRNFSKGSNVYKSIKEVLDKEYKL